MGTPAPKLLVVGTLTADPPIRGRLGPDEFAVEERPPGALPNGVTGFVAVVLDGRSGAAADVLALCRRLGLRPLDDRPPLLYVAPDDSAAARLAGFAHGADAVIGSSASADELMAQLRVLERWRKARDQWVARAAEAQQFSHQLQQAYRQIDLDLRMARRLQASFLPQTLPAVGPIRFAVSYRPCGQVGGDFYDVVRLDEDHVGFYVADAMGHGVPASLLTVFLKKAVQPKEVSGSSYRLLPPGEVLSRLNRDLIAQGLADLPFITMVYGLLNCRDGRLEFARAAHPHPVHLPRVGDPEQWQSPGTLLGVFDAEYRSQQHRLRPGDKLLVFTDGLPESESATGVSAPLLRGAVEHRSLPIQAFVERLSADLVTEQPRPDDFTLLGVEVLAD
ncbi:MAG TPA: SpoIIE family protein phosphatase [Gemmataceae bacterium]|jgi:sigma-B regulation protein RsbU (phosphoserine phosphatase)